MDTRDTLVKQFYQSCRPWITQRYSSTFLVSSEAGLTFIIHTTVKLGIRMFN